MTDVSDWVREVVFDWINQVDDVETLRGWSDAVCDRLRALDKTRTPSERLAHQVTRDRRWILVDVQRERAKVKAPKTVGFFAFGSYTDRVMLVYERTQRWTA